jgi:glycosyltransferase involved in cell wall biosynthesis
MLTEITPLILTYNEAPNLGRTLEQLSWAKDIVVVDSFSTDETLEIAESHPQVRVVQREFDNHAAQWNFGLTQCGADWVLALDADYVLTDELIVELQTFQPAFGVSAYTARFAYCVAGRRLRGTLYPPHAVLFRNGDCHFAQIGHKQQLQMTGPTNWLRGIILHDDRKPLSRWFWAQDRYASMEVDKLLTKTIAELNFRDRLRLCIVIVPALVFFYTLFAKGLILDGWPGWFYVFQRTYVELLLSLRLLEGKMLHSFNPP